jgi:delta 1-pyrroline-5-carboxylate dehydrogenase
MSARERGRILFRLAEHLKANARRFAEVETLNNGKPIAEAEADLSDAAFCFEYYGGMATKIKGDVLTIPDNALSLALKEPVGVAGQIVPWNYPPSPYRGRKSQDGSPERQRFTRADVGQGQPPSHPDGTLGQGTDSVP